MIRGFSKHAGLSVKEFFWRVRVYWEDTDAGGVVFYANYLKFMERARTEWLRSLGFEQDSLSREDDILFAVSKVELVFKNPARLDDALTVSARIIERGKASLTFFQEVRKEDRNNTLLCSGRVKIVCLDARRFRPQPIPQRLSAEISDVQ